MMDKETYSYGIVIQARMSSSRLPGKVLKDIFGKPMLLRQVERLRNGTKVPVVVATSNDKSDDPISLLCSRENISCFRGDLNNVVSRFLKCAQSRGFTHIIRVGGDDPLIDPDCCNELIRLHKISNKDFLYASNTDGWPYGCAAELLSTEVISKIINNTQEKFYLEHTIPYIFDNPNKFKIQRVQAPNNLKQIDLKVSVDYPEDFELIKTIFKELLPLSEFFNLENVISLLKDKEEIATINRGLHQGFDR